MTEVGRQKVVDSKYFRQTLNRKISFMKDRCDKPGLKYFEYLARRFPVMCASDEFHFLPRAEDADRYYDHLDNLDADSINETISIVREFHNQFDRQVDSQVDCPVDFRVDFRAGCENDLEKRLDLELLKANAAGILIEFEKIQSWRHNPLFYLKIAFIGLDHALTKPAGAPAERIDRILGRLNAIPRLLNQAVMNIDGIPETYHQVSLAMLDDCKKYLRETGKNFSGQHSEKIKKGIQNSLSALNVFQNFLCAVSPVPDHRFAGESITASLKDHFLSNRSLDEIFEIVVDEWNANLEILEKLKSKIDPKKSWQELYHNFCPSDVGEKDVIALYQQEAERMRLFFSRHGFREDDLCSSMDLAETPLYLQSIRGSASFAAAFSTDTREKSFFYITIRLPLQSSKEAENLLIKRLHREYRFLTAHETFPGHHLLDSIRRRLENPVRRQIESPLFYEGWAYYAESLLTDYGYVNSPMEYLVDYKRRLWRSARCQIDVGIPSGKLDRQDALNLLMMTGFTKEESIRQIDRFQLNPGYQLCYSLGRYEILKLKESCGMDREQFHTFLLEGGELPFHLIEERIKTRK